MKITTSKIHDSLTEYIKKTSRCLYSGYTDDNTIEMDGTFKIEEIEEILKIVKDGNDEYK